MAPLPARRARQRAGKVRCFRPSPTCWTCTASRAHSRVFLRPRTDLSFLEASVSSSEACLHLMLPRARHPRLQRETAVTSMRKWTLSLHRFLLWTRLRVSGSLMFLELGAGSDSGAYCLFWSTSSETCTTSREFLGGRKQTQRPVVVTLTLPLVPSFGVCAC